MVEPAKPLPTFPWFRPNEPWAVAATTLPAGIVPNPMPTEETCQLRALEDGQGGCVATMLPGYVIEVIWPRIDGQFLDLARAPANIDLPFGLERTDSLQQVVDKLARLGISASVIESAAPTANNESYLSWTVDMYAEGAVWSVIFQDATVMTYISISEPSY